MQNNVSREMSSIKKTIEGSILWLIYQITNQMIDQMTH